MTLHLPHHHAKAPRLHAVILLETVLSLLLIGLVLTMASLVLTRFAAASDYRLNRDRAQFAAEAFIAEIRAGIRPAEPGTFPVAEAVTVSLSIADPVADWQPLAPVEIKATVTGRHNRIATYTVRTYLRDVPAVTPHDPQEAGANPSESDAGNLPANTPKPDDSREEMP